jgi:hypothetical protein
MGKEEIISEYKLPGSAKIKVTSKYRDTFTVDPNHGEKKDRLREYDVMIYEGSNLVEVFPRINSDQYESRLLQRIEEKMEQLKSDSSSLEDVVDILGDLVSRCGREF